MTPPREIELKYRVFDPDALHTALRHLGAKPGRPSHQHDRYFNHPARDYLDGEVVDEWLRVRHEPDGADSIDWKRWLPVGDKVKTSAENHETTIGDADIMCALLDRLGFTPMVTVVKTRTPWGVDGGNVLVHLDHVDGAGDFVEFEYGGPTQGLDDDAIEAVHVELRAFVDRLAGVDLGEIITRGYPHMVLDRDH